MPKIIKINDITTGHANPAQACPGLNPAKLLYTNVFAEDLDICVVGDTFSPHPQPLLANHVTTVALPGIIPISNVFAGAGFPVVMQGGTLTCGDTITLNPVNLVGTQVYLNEI